MTLLSLSALVGLLGLAGPSAAATFPVNAGTLGAIPDGTALAPPAYGAARDVTFTVSGMAGSFASVSVSFGASHTWMGDLEVTLIAPNGANALVFARTGATAAGGVGFGSNLLTSNTYTFTDTAAANWWTAAATNPVAGGTYRSAAPGGAGQVNPAPATSMNPAFAAIPTLNGTWTLRFRDGASADTGSVTSASLTLTSSVAQAKPIDFTGDGKTDIAIVRNTGGGAGGAITWWVGDSASTAFTAQGFGISTDFFVPGDYDGDGKTDYAVWRPGAPGVAGFWILPSSTGVAYFVQFGQTGDDPTVIGDYDGDGKTDVAVYRAGAAAGQQSTWYYKSSAGGNVVATAWGQNGDFPAPGDYDGDAKFDFAIQRNNGGGTAVFWIKQSSGGNVNYVFGTPTDVIVPGDYDGDGKTDLAVVRGSGGAIHWYHRRSSDGGIVERIWGASATDFPCQGDYDGDGKTDLAIWRPSATPSQSAFWVQRSSNGGTTIRQWGQNGDYPVANFNTH